MPLIMICGFPGCGKTTIAKKLEEHLTAATAMKVITVNEESCYIKRNIAYAESREEKNTRATLKAAVDRNVSKSVIVISDSLNYIKGYRYEQWCSSRSAGTPCCVVWVKTMDDTARERNDANTDEQNKWDPKLLNELIMRFEPPASSRRWENPTFEIEENDPIPFDQITAHLTAQSKDIKSMATQHAKISDTNYLHELDRVTQDIVKEILKAQTEIEGQQLVQISISSKRVQLNRAVNMAELRRIRQQFIYLAKSLTQTKADYGEKTAQQIADEFVEYLNLNL